MGFGSDRDRNPEYDEAPMGRREFVRRVGLGAVVAGGRDRKSTRLNSSHKPISYAGSCVKKKTEDRR